MTRYSLHVPEILNDGSPVAEDDFAWVERDILSIGGGFTIVPGIGGWRGEEQQTYREPVRLYLIDVAEDLATARLIEALAERLAAALDQEAVYLTKQHIETILVSPARKENAA